MKEEGRLSPEEALRRSLAETAAETGSEFRIFLGMAAGVGKTYAMLREARVRAEKGLDLVVAWVEPHGRVDTDALLEGLERIPSLKSGPGYPAELDLDAVLARRPAIALVDELAHSNGAGMRHPKRYQDVLELLEAGIGVWTTVNIQHLESMADSVELLTLVPVNERVPDSVFDRADEVQLIDLPPEELLLRLAEGKVYRGPAIRGALDNFFTPANLSALRELSLRQVSNMASHRTTRHVSGDRPGVPPDSRGGSGGAVLVAVGTSPHGQSLLRWGRRLAYALKVDLECVHVETGERQSEADRARLAANLALARDLGARVRTMDSHDVVRGVVGHATELGAFVIVVGKSGLAPRRNRFHAPTLSERLVAESAGTPVFAVQERQLRAPLREKARRAGAALPAPHLLAALAAVILATGLNLFAAPAIGYWSAAIVYLAVISLLGLALEARAVLIAALASAALWDFLFIPPRFTFVISRTEDLLMLALYVLVALTSGVSMSRIKANARLLAVRSSRLSLLGEMAAALSGTTGLGAIAARAEDFFSRAFDAEIRFLLTDPSGDLDEEGGRGELDTKALSAARYAFEKGVPAGRATRTLPASDWHLHPLEATKGRVGVVGLRVRAGRVWSADQEAWLRTMAETVSIALEREVLAAAARDADRSRESERLGSILLDSVTHELRTPLAVVLGSASALRESLLEPSGQDAASERRRLADLAEEIVHGARRLDSIVENLLSMGRLETGARRLRLRACDPADLLSSALAETDDELEGGRVTFEAEADLPELRCDEGLVVQVLSNLLRNAAPHSGPDSQVRLGVAREGGALVFRVRDDGPGVPAPELAHIFEKFRKAKDGFPGGAGLGLSLCKRIVESHGGCIEAVLPENGGFEIRFSLPLSGRAEPGEYSGFSAGVAP